MSIKNNETKLLFNDFEDEKNKKSDNLIDFYVKYKDLGLGNDKQYYCYFYEKQDGEKDFVFDKGYVPKIRKNSFEAYHVNYSCNKNCVGLRFFVTDQEIISGNAENMSPEKNKNVTWYEVKQDENGKKYIANHLPIAIIILAKKNNGKLGHKKNMVKINFWCILMSVVIYVCIAINRRLHQ